MAENPHQLRLVVYPIIYKALYIRMPSINSRTPFPSVSQEHLAAPAANRERWADLQVENSDNNDNHGF